MMNVRNKLKSILPRKLLYYYYLWTAQMACLCENKRRVKDKVYDHSVAEKVKRDLTLGYHILEKGLTMPQPRPGFGKNVVLNTIDNIILFLNLNLSDSALEFKQAVSVIKEYRDYHAHLGYSFDKEIRDKLESLEQRISLKSHFLQLQTNWQDYFANASAPFDMFCLSRYSVRNYISRDIPLPLIYDCIDLAQKSPSFCNRQPTRVYIVKDPAKKKEILEIQNGNRGFGHLADTLLVLSSVISATKDIHERHENHLNGGMFGMTLLYALHFHKVGTCCLNWSVSDDKDSKLRFVLNVPENEIVLMIISCGFLPETFSVASSPRKGFAEICTTYV